MVVYTQEYTCQCMVWQVLLNRATVIGQHEAMTTPRYAPPRFDWLRGAGLAARGSVLTLQNDCS